MKYIRPLSVASLSLALSVAAFAGPVPAAIKARYKALEKALMARDVKAFSTFFDDKFVTMEKGGKPQTKAEFIKMVASMLEGVKEVSSKANLKSAKTAGGTVAVSFDFEMTLAKSDGSRSVVHEVGVDYWKKIGGAWKLVKTIDEKMEMGPAK